MFFSDGKPGGGERRSWGHYKDYKENPAPVLGAARKIKKNFNADFQITRFDTAVSRK